VCHIFFHSRSFFLFSDKEGNFFISSEVIVTITLIDGNALAAHHIRKLPRAFTIRYARAREMRSPRIIDENCHGDFAIRFFHAREMRSRASLTKIVTDYINRSVRAREMRCRASIDENCHGFCYPFLP